MALVDALDISSTNRTYPPAIKEPDGESSVLGSDLAIPDFRITFANPESASDSIGSNLLFEDEWHFSTNITRLEELIVYVADPRDQLSLDIRQSAKLAENARRHFSSRLKALQEEARLENLQINLASRRDFVAFISAISVLKRGSLALLDNGNLKATWKAGVGERLTLEFKGGERAHHVIFKRREGQETVSRHSGEDTLDFIEAQIKSLKAENLISE